MASSERLTQSQEHDMYVAQLREVFLSCGETDSSTLGREGLQELCERLQLEDQSEYLVGELLKDKDEVDFDEFQLSFVKILQDSYTNVGSSSEDEASDGESDEGDIGEDNVDEDNDDNAEEDNDDVNNDDDNDDDVENDSGKEDDKDEENPVKREVSPKFSLGSKRYGRRSLPGNLDDLGLVDLEDIEVASSTQSLKHSLVVQEDSDSDEDSSASSKKRQRTDGRTAEVDEEVETFEAEGQLNSGAPMSQEEEYLHDIWTSLGVGANGYIDIDELASVCKHIGMGQMNNVELQQLFDKLDSDGDGRVSFRDFLNEYFQQDSPPTRDRPPTGQRSKGVTPTRASPAPRSKGTTPTRALSAQKKLKFPGSEDRITPSIVQGIGVTGFFSGIDPERTGFAKPDAILDFWETYNITNGADVLVALGFDLNAKVNLSELSAALEQELLNTEEQSIVYQAATASYQQEMRHLKSALEQAVWAKDKLKLDLAESNYRNSMLAKEVDERHASMEQTSQSKLLTIEQKYQEQVRVLQSELDRERENLAQLSVRHKQNLEREMDELRHEDARLREHLLQAQKEIERHALELEEVTGQLGESEKVGQRLQRELDTMQDLHAKLAEYERQVLTTPEEQQFTQEKLLRLEQENKELKDQNDELKVELESVKVTGRVADAGAEQHTPIRKDGSIMSDYIRPVVVKKVEACSSAECSEDEGRGASSQSRKLPAPSHADDDISIGDPSDKETIDQLRRELADSRDHFETDRRDIEQAYRLEITAIEERHDREKAQLLQHIEHEKEKLSGEFERLQKEALSELARELQTQFAREKESLVHKHETQRNHLEVKHKEERDRLAKRLKTEHKEEIENQRKELTTKYEQERFALEETLAGTEPLVQQLESEKAVLEQKLKQTTEQNERALRQEKAEMEGMLTRHMQNIADVERSKHDLEMTLKKTLSDQEMENKKAVLELDGEVERLKHSVREEQQKGAQLEIEIRQQKEELEIAARQERQEMVEVYEARLRQLDDDRNSIQRRYDNIFSQGVDGLEGRLKSDFYQLLDGAIDDRVQKQRAVVAEQLEHELKTDFDTKHSELSHMFEREKSEIQERYEEQIKALRDELERLQGKLEEEREALAERYTVEKEVLEDQLAQQIREELEEELVQQMEEIKEAYEEERREIDSQNALLKQEVDQLQTELEAGNQHRKKADELKRANNKLQQEKRQLEKSKSELERSLEDTKQALESRIEELKAEKDGAITAVKTQYVESSKQSGRDKAAYDTILIEKEGLERKVTSLTQELAELQTLANTSKDLQRQVEQLSRENGDLRNRSTDQPMAASGPVPEHAQRAINELTHEKRDLEERLVDMQTRYEEIEDMAKKYSHLQFDFDQMSIGHTVVEESLLRTQDQLANKEAKLHQSERELKDARRYKDRYKLLQRKYEDVSKERDKVSHLAKSLKEQLNKASTAHREEHEEKGQFTAVLEEKKMLELQLQKISDKLLEATTNFSLSQAQHIQELQQWKEQCGNMVDLQKYTKLQIDLVDNQRSLRDLQEVVKTKEENSSKVFQETSEKHHEAVKSLETQKDTLMRQLSTLQQILDGQITKFKQQYEAHEKRNALVVDLYKENADLMDSLYRVEQQKKDAISRCYRLEDQCINLRKMLKKVAKVAIT